MFTILLWDWNIGVVDTTKITIEVFRVTLQMFDKIFEGSGSVLLTELKGIYQGLKLANNLGYKNVCLEYDNADAVALMKNGCSF